MHCPNCNIEIKEHEPKCPECGQFITEENRLDQKTNFAYSSLGYFTLTAGQYAALIIAFMSLIAIPAQLFKSNLIDGLLTYPMYFVVSMALYIVFVRVRDLK